MNNFGFLAAAVDNSWVVQNLYPKLLGSRFFDGFTLFCHPGLDPGSMPSAFGCGSGSWIAGQARNDALEGTGWSSSSLERLLKHMQLLVELGHLLALG